MTPEQQAHQAIRREMGGLWHFQRHEDKYSPDIPDISFAYRDRHGWIELKAAKAGDPIKLRPGQLNWMIARGGNCLFVVRELSKAGKHLGWVGVGMPGISVLRETGQATSDTLRALPGAMLSASFIALLNELLGSKQ